MTASARRRVKGALVYEEASGIYGLQSMLDSSPAVAPRYQ